MLNMFIQHSKSVSELLTPQIIGDLLSFHQRLLPLLLELLDHLLNKPEHHLLICTGHSRIQTRRPKTFMRGPTYRIRPKVLPFLWTASRSRCSASLRFFILQLQDAQLKGLIVFPSIAQASFEPLNHFLEPLCFQRRAGLASPVAEHATRTSSSSSTATKVRQSTP